MLFNPVPDRKHILSQLQLRTEGQPLDSNTPDHAYTPDDGWQQVVPGSDRAERSCGTVRSCSTASKAALAAAGTA